MSSPNFDTPAETEELRATGIEAAHAEAIVSAVGRSVDGLLTESRFEAAMAEQTAYMDKRLSEQRTSLIKQLGEQRTSLIKQLGEQRTSLIKQQGKQHTSLIKQQGEQHTSLTKQLTEQYVQTHKRLTEQSVAFAELKSDLFRYLWLHGSMIILVLILLYAMVESWARG